MSQQVSHLALKDSILDLSVSNSYADLPPEFYTRLQAHALREPRLLHANAEVAAMIGLSQEALLQPDFLAVCSGQQPLNGGKTLAAVYSGHQFGVWAGQLGDGRAHLLGEVPSQDGGTQELQLKGAGQTPYSRMGDGRAVLRSSVREYLASEAMAGLGIASTRALALVVSDDSVYRETVETAAIVTRVSPSFVRFGTFEHWSGQSHQLQALFDYVVDKFYPECRDTPAGDDSGQAGVVLRFLRAVMHRTAVMVADWQTSGFCHGVMNTDNMSILGLTIDYGPYGFMDAFQAGHVCNHSDTQGRYAWNRQPTVALWNLYRLASSLIKLGPTPEALKAELQQFEALFLQAYHDNIRRKFGFLHWQADDSELLDDWWSLLHNGRMDFTLSFRLLAQVAEQPEAFLDLSPEKEEAQHWLTQYKARLAQENRPQQEKIDAMQGANPLYVLRNHLAEQAIRAAQQGDASEIETLLRLLRDPFTEVPDHKAYAAVPPDWAAQIAVSCSS